MAPENFGALLHKTSIAIRNQVPNATIYAGSVNVPDDLDQIGKAASYITKMYQFLNENDVYASTLPYGYGWNALGVNIHGFPRENFTASLWASMRSVAVAAQHLPFSIMVGEWGSENSNLEDIGIGSQRVRETFLAIRKYFPTMYFYIHPYDSTNDFGAIDWDEYNGVFRKTGERSWYDELRNHLYTIED